jgi:hypothetical protein
MFKTSYTALFVCLFLIWSPNLLAADKTDVVVMNNGDRLIGEIKQLQVAAPVQGIVHGVVGESRLGQSVGNRKYSPRFCVETLRDFRTNPSMSTTIGIQKWA